MAKKNHFQISTAIDYPSGRFHLGHAYEKTVSDVLARWKRLQGYKVHFSTGTDCHGLKIQRNAEKAGKSPKEFAEEMSKQFKELAKRLEIGNDDFIMTTEKRHKETVRYILDTLHKNGEIYKGEYEGLYCVDCETYYTEKDLENGHCPVHKTKVEKIKEESYFFKLSKYQDLLIKEISKGNLVWPKKKEKEILNRLKEPLRDLSISREQVSWGIPLPFDKDKTVFVWIEALINYLSTIGYPDKKYKDFWPTTQMIGSDIVWHHTAIWYSVLSALKLELPKVVVHGFINVKGAKLSKAQGLSVDPIELIDKYGLDTLRYFLVRNIPFGEDGDFSEQVLIERHNNELANKLGNLITRVTALAEKNGVKKTDNKLLKKLNLRKIEKHFEEYQIDRSLSEIFAFIDTCNEYIQKNKIWETKDTKKLYELIDSIKAISILLHPFIPETSEKIADHLKFKIDYKNINKPIAVSKIKKAPILFKKIEVKEVEPEKEIKTKHEGVINMGEVTFDDWQKIDLRVAKILKAEDIEGADKLYKLSIDLGDSKRTICAGIKEFYKKDELKGKQIIVFANLAPRKMRGILSEGMLLAADNNGKPTLISPEKSVKLGSKIH